MAAPTFNKTSCTLDGKYLLAEGVVDWTYTEGSSPHIAVYYLSPSDALALTRGRPVTLQIVPPEGPALTVTNLWVLNILPGPVPYVSAVKVADRRWFWSYKQVGPLYFNMRRTVGVKRILLNDNLAVNIDTAEDIAYHTQSLKKGKAWEPRQIIERVAGLVAEKEAQYWGQTFPLKIDERLGSKIAGLPIEDLPINAAGDVAMDLVKKNLPEAGIKVDPDGSVVFYARASGDEKDIVKALMPEIRDEGHTDLVKNAFIRPSKIVFKYMMLVETRHDFIEQTSSRSSAADLGEQRLMENVAPCPDPNLVMSGQTIVQGTYKTIDQYLNAWGNLPLIGIPLDHDIIQRAFMPDTDLWSPLGIYGEQVNDDGTLAPWSRRITTLQQHYRLTFRLNPKWVDAYINLYAARVATIDPQRGTKAPAPAYGDYCIVPSQRHRWRNQAQGKPQDRFINRTGYPGEDVPIADNGEMPPCTVRIVDHDQGIIHLDYALDVNRAFAMVLPSQIHASNIPTADLVQRSRSITTDHISGSTRAPKLSSAYKMCTILLMMPATPLSTFDVEVKPSDIADKLPAAAAAGLSEANGPVMEVLVPSTMEVARVMWRESAKENIERIFFPDRGPRGDISQLVMNLGDTRARFGGSLNSIAKGWAASIYASLTDRYEGDMTGYMQAGVTLAGWASEVSQQVDSQSVAVTRAKFPPHIPQLDLASFLDSSTRYAIFKLVMPQ